MSWTDEEIKRAVSMRHAGSSAGQIAAALRTKTRNAVIGKLLRLGIAAPPTRSRGKASEMRVKKANGHRFVEKKTRAMPKLKQDTEVTRDQGVALMELQPHHCRWPYGSDTDFYFCGRLQMVGSYCEQHHRKSLRMYNPNPMLVEDK